MRISNSELFDRFAQVAGATLQLLLPVVVVVVHPAQVYSWPGLNVVICSLALAGHHWWLCARAVNCGGSLVIHLTTGTGTPWESICVISLRLLENYYDDHTRRVRDDEDIYPSFIQVLAGDLPYDICVLNLSDAI